LLLLLLSLDFDNAKIKRGVVVTIAAVTTHIK